MCVLKFRGKIFRSVLMVQMKDITAIGNLMRTNGCVNRKRYAMVNPITILNASLRWIFDPL